MASLIDKAIAARKLPPGHVDRTKAQKAVKDEYAACLELERRWNKKLRKYSKRVEWTPERVRVLVDHLTDLFGARRIKEINYNVPQHSGAFYFRGTINFRWGSAGITTIIHELAHHWAVGHRAVFLAREEMLFQATLNFLRERTRYGIVTF